MITETVLVVQDHALIEWDMYAGQMINISVENMDFAFQKGQMGLGK